MRRRSRIAATVRNRRAAVNIRMISVVFNVFYRFVIYFCNLLCGFSGIVYANLSLCFSLKRIVTVLFNRIINYEPNYPSLYR